MNVARKTPVILGLLLTGSIVLANVTDSAPAVLTILSIASFAQGMSNISWTMLSEVAPSETIGLAGASLAFSPIWPALSPRFSSGLSFLRPVHITERFCLSALSHLSGHFLIFSLSERWNALSSDRKKNSSLLIKDGFSFIALSLYFNIELSYNKHNFFIS